MHILSKLCEYFAQVNRSRMAHWEFSLAIILLCITVFIPLSFSLALTYRRSANGTRFSVTRRSVLKTGLRFQIPGRSGGRLQSGVF